MVGLSLNGTPQIYKISPNPCSAPPTDDPPIHQCLWVPRDFRNLPKDTINGNAAYLEQKS